MQKSKHSCIFRGRNIFVNSRPRKHQTKFARETFFLIFFNYELKKARKNAFNTSKRYFSNSCNNRTRLYLLKFRLLANLNTRLSCLSATWRRIVLPAATFSRTTSWILLFPLEKSVKWREQRVLSQERNLFLHERLYLKHIPAGKMKISLARYTWFCFQCFLMLKIL